MRKNIRIIMLFFSVLLAFQVFIIHNKNESDRIRLFNDNLNYENTFLKTEQENIQISKNKKAKESEKQQVIAYKQELERKELERQKQEKLKQQQELAKKRQEQLKNLSYSPEIIQGSQMQMSKEDFYLFACIITVEAGGESHEAQLGVANVILNRIRSGRHPNVRSVVYARGQFPPATNGVLDRRLQLGPFNSSIHAANEALSGKNNIGGRNHFNGYYGQYFPNAIIIGRVIFY